MLPTPSSPQGEGDHIPHSTPTLARGGVPHPDQALHSEGEALSLGKMGSKPLFEEF